MLWYQPEINFSPTEVLAYLRKSRTDDPQMSVEEVLSKHETILDDWAEQHLGEPVPEVNKFREIVSGETIADRPEIQKVLSLIESPKIKAILTVEVQRLSRGDLEDSGRLIKLLRYTNTLVITPTKIYDISNEYDRDAFERELKRGNEFLEYQKKIMNRGKELSVMQGNFIGSIPPYGYDKVWVQEGKRKVPTLASNPSEAETQYMMFDMAFNQQLGNTTIAHRLNDLGIKPRKADYWTPNAVKDILSNPACIGKIRWNWRKTVTVVSDGEITKTRPKNAIGDYILIDGKHPANIPEYMFYGLQERRGKTPRVTAKAKVRNPLAGLVYCQCGRAMSLRTYKKDGKERAPARLLCDNQAFCGTSSCLYDEILDRITTILSDCISDFEIKLKNDNKDVVKRHAMFIKRLEDKYSELERKEIAQWEKYSEEGMPKSIFDTLNAKVLAEKEDVKAAILNAKLAMPTSVDYQERLCRFRDALNGLNNPDMPAAEKNKLLKACIKRIDYKRKPSVRKTKSNSNEKLSVGGNWTTTPIELDVQLYV